MGDSGLVMPALGGVDGGGSTGQGAARPGLDIHHQIHGPPEGGRGGGGREGTVSHIHAVCWSMTTTRRPMRSWFLPTSPSEQLGSRGRPMSRPLGIPYSERKVCAIRAEKNASYRASFLGKEPHIKTPHS